MVTHFAHKLRAIII